MSSTDPGVRPDLWVAALCGLGLALSYPRPDLYPLAFIAVAPLLVLLRGQDGRGTLLRGFVFGATFFAILLYWIAPVMVRFGGLPWAASLATLALLVAYLAGFFALFAWTLGAWIRRFGPVALLLAPLPWVALELLRGRLLSGFPWGLLGYSQYRNLPLLQMATLGGIYAVSFVVMACNGALALLVDPMASRRSRIAALVVLAGVAAAHLAGGVLLPPADVVARGEPIRVAALQGNVAQDLKWRPGTERAILDDMDRLTRQAAADGAVLVVWPESATPYSFFRGIPGSTSASRPPRVIADQGYIDRLTRLADDLGITLIVGSVDYDDRGDAGLRAFNSAFVLAPGEGLGERYAKRHLVPFGEYVPVRRLLFFVNRLVQGAISEFAPGTRVTPLPTPVGPAATFICYEAIFPEMVLQLSAGSDFLVNITNDAWYGNTSGPYQHLAMAAVRAVETRRFLVRAANTGISAIVDPAGRIVERSSLNERAVLLGTIAARRQATLYARTGDRLAWGCVILTFLIGAALRAAFLRPAD